MSTVDLIPRNVAVLCVNCDQISASTGACIACGSEALLSVARIVDGPNVVRQTRNRRRYRRQSSGAGAGKHGGVICG